MHLETRSDFILPCSTYALAGADFGGALAALFSRQTRTGLPPVIPGIDIIVICYKKGGYEYEQAVGKASPVMLPAQPTV